MPMKKLTMNYVTVRMMYKMSKCKENKPKVRMLPWRCDKAKRTINLRIKAQGRTSIAVNWVTLHVFATKQITMNVKMQEIQKNDGDDAFVMHNRHNPRVCPNGIWIQQPPCTLLHIGTIEMYKVINSYNMYLDDDSVVKSIGMGSILVKTIVRGKINRIVYHKCTSCAQNYKPIFSWWADLCWMIWTCNST